jgi:adenosine 3'-phospho 5'-phosphosulfate transporter B2
MFQFPKFVFDCLILSVCSAAGQLFIYYTIATFGPVVFVIIMTIRQVNNLIFYYINDCAVNIIGKVVPMHKYLAIESVCLGYGAKLHRFLNSAIGGCEWSA